MTTSSMHCTSYCVAGINDRRATPAGGDAIANGDGWHDAMEDGGGAVLLISKAAGWTQEF